MTSFNKGGREIWFTSGLSTLRLGQFPSHWKGIATIVIGVLLLAALGFGSVCLVRVVKRPDLLPLVGLPIAVGVIVWLVFIERHSPDKKK